LYNKKANKELKIANNDEFVNEKSNKPSEKGMIFIIVNCSNGEKNIDTIN